jgi:dihydroorotase
MDVLAEMEHRDLVLMCHGEAPGFVLDREDLFLPLLGTISDKFPKLRLTLEHISTANGINYVSYLDGIGRRILGTITLHHMMRTLNDVVGGKLQPDEFCMPIPKLPRDRVSITNAAFMNSKCFALGSDSAPHDQKMKYCKGGCAGVFTAPVLAESLMEMYRPSIAERFVNFTSKNAANFYGFQPSGRRIAFERKPWLVPATHGLVTTFRGLETLEWSLKTPSSFKGIVNS